MPYIKITTSKKVSESTEAVLYKELGRAIELIPGKTESWLMLSIHDAERMAFKGSTEDCAMMEVEIFGSASSAAKNALTGRLCELAAEQLGVRPDRTYVTYREVDTWGWDGENF